MFLHDASPWAQNHRYACRASPGLTDYSQVAVQHFRYIFGAGKRTKSTTRPTPTLKPSPGTRHHNKIGDKFTSPMFDYMLELVSLLVRSSDLRSEAYGVRQSRDSVTISRCKSEKMSNSESKVFPEAV